MIDEADVVRFVHLLHERAAVALKHVPQQDRGVLQLCRMLPDDTSMHTTAYEIGDTSRMVHDAIADARAGFNVYAELRTTVRGRPTERGKFGATRGVIGFGIDRDSDTGKGGRELNGDATITVETSPGNVQQILFLERALSAADAVLLGAAIRAATGADSCTGNVCQPLRVPGTPNYPSEKKRRERGRVTVPTRISAVSGKVWTRNEIVAAFPPKPVHKAAASPATRPRRSSARVTAKARRKATATMDRSAEFQSTVAAAVRAGMTPDELEATMRANPQGACSKFLEGRDRLRAEIERSWAKAEAASEAPTVTPDPNADGAALLDDVSVFLARFVVYPSTHARAAHALWCAHAHSMDAWESTPRLAFLSPERETGKTRALEITQLLVPRPVLVCNASPAFLFRKVADDAGLPTILFDEVDCLFKEGGEGREDLRALLNAGYRRGATVGRCAVYGKTVAPEELPAYAAVALAGINTLPDTVASRAVLIHMRRRAPDEAVESFRFRLHAPQGHALRDRLASWMAGVAERVTGVMPSMPDGVQDRCADVWEPLLALADAAGGGWPDTARCCAVALVASLRETQGESYGTRLLADVRSAFGDDSAMPTERLLTKLREMPESPWADIKGKPLNDRGLATRLRPYGIKSKVIRVGDKTPRGYTREDFHDAWKRYLPPLL
jgi:hypothetical protein